MEENHETVQEAQSTKSSSMNPLMIVGVLAVVLIGGSALMMSRNSTESSPSATDSTESVQEKKMAPEGAMVEGEANSGTSDASGSGSMEEMTVTVEAGAFYYKPAEIKVKKGQKIKIVMNSVDMMHDFNIDELGVKIPIAKSGETGTVEFTADQAGTFEYYCSVGQHRQNGQVGTLIVEE